MMHLTRSTLAGMAVLVASLLAGCTNRAVPSKGKDTEAVKSAKAEAPKGHAHPDKGPHGGPLAEWGEEDYHAEFTVERGKKQATVYILDGSARKAAPIPAETLTLDLTSVKPPVQLTLKADPLAGEPAGQSSRFVGTHDALGQDAALQGEISGKVKDTPYAGAFKEKAPAEPRK